jgi:hypothetical protein
VVAALAAMLVVVASHAGEPELDPGTESAVIALASDLAEHPEARPHDLYKFLHQALFGPGHAIPDAAAAAAYLEQEIAGLAPAEADEAWCVPLGGRPALVRVNLRPFVANGFDDQELLKAFVETANRVAGDPEQMTLAVDLVAVWLQDEGRGPEAGELRRLADGLKGDGYPAIHHSAAYLEAYDPAYRVVSAESASEHGWCGRAYGW